MMPNNSDPTALKLYFQCLVDCAGHAFVGYILNIDAGVFSQKTFADLDLSSLQLSVLRQLGEKLMEARRTYVAAHPYGDGSVEFIGNLPRTHPELLASYHKQCGGEVPTVDCADDLLRILSEFATSAYASFLVKPSRTHSRGNPIFAVSYRPSLPTTQISALVRALDADKIGTLAKNRDGPGSSQIARTLCFTTSMGTSFNIQYGLFGTVIVGRAFRNCFNRGAYSLAEVLAEVSSSLDLLRDLADGKTRKFSTFVGISGLRFEGISELALDSCILRETDGSFNPNHLVSALHQTTSGEDGRQVTSHCLELVHNVVIQPSEPDVGMRYMSAEVTNSEDDLITMLRLAIAFSRKRTQTIGIDFREPGFPLAASGNYVPGSHVRATPQTITSADVSGIERWFKKLGCTDLSRLRIPIRRLLRSMEETNEWQDSLVDAVVAWEAMFGDTQSTQFKVTGSIACYLFDGQERTDQWKKLKSVYAARSAVVHGGEVKNKTFSSNSAMTEWAIDKGLRCLEKLLTDTNLLDKTSHERANALLLEV